MAVFAIYSAVLLLCSGEACVFHGGRNVFGGLGLMFDEVSRVVVHRAGVVAAKVPEVDPVLL